MPALWHAAGNIEPDFTHSYMNTGQGDNDMGSAPPL